MDPRTSATVTAPDLLKAFAEGRGVDPDAEDSGSGLTIWVAYGEQDNVEYVSFPMTSDGLMQALKLVKEYLSAEGHTLILVVSAERPASFQTAISAADD